MTENIAIKVENLSKCYHIYDQPKHRLMQMLFRGHKQFYREFWALKGVSFEVRRGETVGIIGRNGSGKSTLLQMICGTLNPTSGTVMTNGRIAALLELGSGFNPEFTGRENVYMNASVLGLTKEETDARFAKITDFAGIGDFIDQPVRMYSSGMIMRLAFAVSVCVEPDVLIVDEALAVGDMAFQFKCMDRLRRLADGGTTLLFVSHDMGMVKSFCSRVVYLEKGKSKAVGAPDEMAEIYALDMRDEQRRSSGAAKGVIYKPFIGRGDGIAFGTDEGHILAAVFENTGSAYSSYRRGDEVVIKVTIKVRNGVSNPSLSVLVFDRRMVDIGGAFFSISDGEVINGWSYAEMQVRWPVLLSGGGYCVTLRLESRQDERHFQPIDKQVGVMTFEVMDENPTFLGVVDLNMHSHIIPCSAGVDKVFS